jgi:nucleoside-diphosphate-sugar epimerase
MPDDSRILISGAASGLGKFLLRTLGGDSWTRALSSAEREEKRRTGFDVIIHCAYNSGRDITSSNLCAYLFDNVLLTQELLAIPHRKFIFVSTVDVYPKDEVVHSEAEVLKLDSMQGIYGITKLMSESLALEIGRKPLVLRCSALLGCDARPNSLFRMAQPGVPKIMLTPNSEFNYVLHRDVGTFVLDAIQHDHTGIYNLAASGNVCLGDLASHYGWRIEFGTHRYMAGHVSNDKVCAEQPSFRRSSFENAQDFVRGITHNQSS